MAARGVVVPRSGVAVEPVWDVVWGDGDVAWGDDAVVFDDGAVRRAPVSLEVVCAFTAAVHAKIAIAANVDSRFMIPSV